MVRCAIKDICNYEIRFHYESFLLRCAIKSDPKRRDVFRNGVFFYFVSVYFGCEFEILSFSQTSIYYRKEHSLEFNSGWNLILVDPVNGITFNLFDEIRKVNKLLNAIKKSVQYKLVNKWLIVKLTVRRTSSLILVEALANK